MKKNNKTIEFFCPKCKTTEHIPTDIVEMLDAMDSVGKDLSYPPRFDCKNCNEKMVPTHYVSVNETVHTYKQINIFYR